MRDEELREALIEMFSELLRVGMPQPEHLADELLAVVRRYADQRAAEELRAVADLLTDRARTWVLNQLRDRADALTSEATT